MSLLKSVSTEISGKTVQLVFPDKKTLIMRGANSLQMMHILECLLGQDFTGYYWSKDKEYGFSYKPVSGVSRLVFNNGAILGKDKEIQVQGEIPNIHVIRYLQWYTIRSFYLSNNLNNYSPLYTNLTQYSNILQDTQWYRIITMVNKLAGFEFVRLEDETLKFNFDETYGVTSNGLKLIYTLISECFVTPDNYSRVLLLPNINVLTQQKQIELLESLDNIKGHTLTLSSASISPDSLSEDSIISFINV
jgi:hypothetical protein